MTKNVAALAARSIREELKAIGIAASVTSKLYSGGSSVNVYLQHPDNLNVAKSIVKKYQYGHFDGQTDTYEVSNNIENIPQAQFVFVHADF